MKNVLFPDIPGDYNNVSKLFMLGIMTNRLCQVILKRRNVENKYNFVFKRLFPSGILFKNFFSNAYSFYLKQLNVMNYVYEEDNNKFDTNVISNDYLTNELHKALSSGTWVKGREDGKNEGISQDLDRLNYISTLSMLRRTNNKQIDSTDKDPKPRLLYTSHWGMLCVCETPEGAKTGITKTLALMCEISLDVPIQHVSNLIKKSELIINLENILKNNITNYTKVLINNYFFYLTSIPNNLIEYIKDLKQKNILPFYVCYNYDTINNEIHIRCNEGRCVRPLYTISQLTGKLNINGEDILLLSNNKYDWNDLVQTGKIEYVDIEQEKYILCALTINEVNKKYTHCEIHPTMMFGVSASIIPFANRNAAPRNVFSCQMSFHVD